MSLKQRTETLRKALFHEPEQHCFAVLDGAAFEGVPALLRRLGTEHVCLMRGEIDPELAQVAPYLVALPADGAFADHLLEHGWGQAWGIVVRSSCDFRTVRMHLRQLLEVWDPDGRPLFFRFYDPRVLRIFLPTCDDEQLGQLFDDVVESFFVESEDGGGLERFSLGSGGLGRTETMVPSVLAEG